MTSTAYKQTMAILMASLLALVHCQPLAALPSRSQENLEDQVDVSDDFNELEDTDTPEDLQDSADTTEVSEFQVNALPALHEDLNDSTNTHNVTDDLEDVPEPSHETLDDPEEATDLQEAPEPRSHAVGLFLRQLLPLIASAFFSSVTTVIFNWFYPFKVVPPPPGLVGVSQLWGGLPHPKHWPHHWGHLRQGPGKWGNGNWAPAHSGHTPPAHGFWEPHPHAHL